MPEVPYARSNVILTLVPSSQSLEACVSKDQHKGNDVLLVNSANFARRSIACLLL